MTELEQIAYDNGVACGFMVARGIGMSPLPVEHEMLKYENWTDEMKAMLIEKPYYMMYSWRGISKVHIVFSEYPFALWSPRWSGGDASQYISSLEIRFYESVSAITSFEYISTNKVFTKITNTSSIYYANDGIKLRNSYFNIFYTNGLTSVFNHQYENVKKFPLKLKGAATSYYKPQNHTAFLDVTIINTMGSVHDVTTVTYNTVTCHGGDIYAYMDNNYNSQGDISSKYICFTNTYLWDNCITDVYKNTKEGEQISSGVHRRDYFQVWNSFSYYIWSHTCSIPVFSSKESLTNYLNTGMYSEEDFEYIP